MIAGARIDIACMKDEKIRSLKKEVMFNMLHALDHKNATELFHLTSDQKLKVKKAWNVGYET